MRPGGSSRPITARPVTDSPTTPSTSPLAISNDTPSMARRVSRRVTNSTPRSRTERTGTVMRSDTCKGRRASSEFWIERVAQPVPEQVDGEDQSRQRETRKGDDPPLAREQIVVADPDQGSERGHGVGHAGAEKRQRRLGDDRKREVDGGDYQDRPHRVGQHVAQHDYRRGKPDQLRRRDIIL